jgi:hypothetical protein
MLPLDGDPPVHDDPSATTTARRRCRGSEDGVEQRLTGGCRGDGGDVRDDAEGGAALLDRREHEDELPGVGKGRRRALRRGGAARSTSTAASGRDPEQGKRGWVRRKITRRR